MTDHDALLAAVCAEADEDTPRLVYADFLEENGEPERAAFIRRQVEVARCPPWEPLAVEWRWRRDRRVSGAGLRATLPPVPEPGLAWPSEPFRRGLPGCLYVRSLFAWEQAWPTLIGRVPLEEVVLWGAATLEDWHRFADSPLASRLRRLEFVSSPVDPLRVFRHRREFAGVTDLVLRRASGSGIPFVIEDLLAAPLGRVLRGLHLHVGYEALEDLVEALNGGAPELDRLTLATMGLTEFHVAALMAGPVVSGLRELDLRDNPLGNRGVWRVIERLPVGVHTLGLAATGAGGHGLDVLATSEALAWVRRLDLSRNPFTPRAARTLARSPFLAGLRSLNLSGSRIGERELYHLVRARFWSGLVELDLRDNPIPLTGWQHLLDAPVPEELTALVVSANRTNTDLQTALRRKYGERVVFAGP